MINIIFNQNSYNEEMSFLQPCLFMRNESIDRNSSDSNGFDSEYDLESISSNKMTEIFNLWNDSNQLPSIDKSPSLPDKQQTITNNYKSINEIMNNNSSTYLQSKERGLQEIHLKEKIFKITKDYKGKGRIKKNTIYVGKHNKFSEDNIIRKIKGKFLEKCRLYINDLYKKHLLKKNRDPKKERILLQRLNPNVSRKIKRNLNLEWLESKLYQVFSENVSEKCTSYDEDYNERQIKVLFSKDEATEVIKILKRSVKEMFHNYTNNEEIDGFKTLKDDLEEIKKKMNEEKEEYIDKYLNKYKSIAENLEDIFINKSSRTNNVKKPKV